MIVPIRYDRLMPLSTAPQAARRSEAERLIALARALLTDKSEEMAVIYLDQAAEALRALPDEAGTEFARIA